MILFVLTLVSAHAADIIELWDLEADDGSLVSAGEIGAWEWGVVESGPGMGFVGTRAWATNLDGTYGNDSVETLTLPFRDLVALAQPTLCWMQWLDLEAGDVGRIEWTEAGSGASVVVAPIYGYPDGDGFAGYTGSWDQICLDLDGAGDLGNFQLVFTADDKVSATGWYVDELSLYDGDPVSPRLSQLDALPDTEDLDGSYPVSVSAIDNMGLDVVRIGWRLDGVDQTTILMSGPSDDDRWTGLLPGQAHGSVVEYWVDASDGQNWARLPVSGAETFAVRLPAPTGLSGPEGRVVATTAELDWTAPDSGHVLTGYRVYRDDSLVAEATDPPFSVALVGGGGDVLSVSAVFDVGESDPSEPLTLDSHVPQVLGLSPAQAYQGDQIRIDLLGENLLFVQGDLLVDMGEGLEVLETDVIDVDYARLLVAVGEGAAAKVRDVEVFSGLTALTLDAAFQVLDGADRPHLVSVEPTFLTQGTEAELVILASHAFAALPEVTLGEGMVISEVAWVEDDELRVHVAVELNAPVGEHDLKVDDGERVHDGLTVRVRDDPPATTRCSSSGPPPAPAWRWALLGLLGVISSRRQRT